MKILFMGTPLFAVPSLEALVAAGHQVVGVFSQPDKPKNRGMKLQPTPVKVCAQVHDIPVFQPTKLRDGAALETIRQLEPDLIVVAAYGRILPQEILDYPRLGCVNVHSSLLPKYRGAAPINWAILNGEKETGVTIMHMAPALDAGDIIAQRATPIDPDETAEALYDRLARLGADLLAETLPRLADGTAPRTPQAEDQATLAPMLSRDLSPMDFTRPAQALHDQVRGLIPWPAATMDLNGVRCKVFATAVLGETTGKAPGSVIQADKKGLKLACGGGTVLGIQVLQAAGGKRMAAADYLRGHPVPVD
ncbi:MAG TPA: methionyl-tRNA formyltransferase [Candidatus Evtepia faecavium]|nr:methionyl-tRNA formyltransferase [Candidatus Evtepia faecavium]